MNATNQHTRIVKLCLVSLLLHTSCLFSGCYRNDIRTEIIAVPSLGSEPCNDYLEANISRLRGIQKVEGDPFAKEVEVVFDARNMSLRNVEHHIARIGFDVQATPLSHEPDEPYLIPGAEAAKKRLPPECQ